MAEADAERSRGPTVIDTHAHLYFESFDGDREQVLARAAEAGVRAIINVGIDPATSRQAVALAGAHAGLHAAVGLHPASPLEDAERALLEVASLARSHRREVVAIGEIGLDYHWKEVAPAEQRPRLEQQLALARELGLPVIFHCREALDELLEILERSSALPPGVFHCFSGGPAEAHRALALGFHVSFAGNVTYPKARELQEAARAVPLERLLLETDSPFLAPQPCRGRRNEPAFVRHSCQFLAGLKGVSNEELAAATADSSARLFGPALRERPAGSPRASPAPADAGPRPGGTGPGPAPAS